MNTFPIITHIDQLREKVGHLPEIRFAEQSNGTTVVCYMIADKDTFSGPDAMWARECRGITFDKNGYIICRPLHKFFNVNEREDTCEELLPWNNIARTMEKLDGSMIAGCVVDGQVVFKSKKSFESDVALLANRIATKQQIEFVKRLAAYEMTPIFEITSPLARIVIKFTISTLTLLHIRCNIDGRYLSRCEVEDMAMDYGIHVVEEFEPAPWDSTRDYLEEVKNFEGFVFQFLNGEMVKAKSKWYKDRHHAMTQMTERNIAEMVIDETLDDVKSYIRELGENELLARIEEIESSISSKITMIALISEALYNEDKHLSKKEFAIKNKNQENFGLLMNLYDGKEPNYAQFYARNYLKVDWKVLSL